MTVCHGPQLATTPHNVIHTYNTRTPPPRGTRFLRSFFRGMRQPGKDVLPRNPHAGLGFDRTPHGRQETHCTDQPLWHGETLQIGRGDPALAHFGGPVGRMEAVLDRRLDRRTARIPVHGCHAVPRRRDMPGIEVHPLPAGGLFSVRMHAVHQVKLGIALLPDTVLAIQLGPWRGRRGSAWAQAQRLQEAGKDERWQRRLHPVP
eukprot:scaffold1056_cov107-Isochrysis_galbana.AAC.1